MDVAKLKPLGCREINSTVVIKQIQNVNLMGYFGWRVQKKQMVGKTGLLLKVDAKHKGWVLITLNSLDLYNVYILNNWLNIKETFNNIYHDQLFDTINNSIKN